MQTYLFRKKCTDLPGNLGTMALDLLIFSMHTERRNYCNWDDWGKKNIIAKLNKYTYIKIDIVNSSIEKKKKTL